MSEKKKKNTPQEQPEPEKTTNEAPAEDTAPAPEVVEEETFTVTREQMEQFESLAKLVSDGNDKYLRLAAEYDNYRKRTTKEKDNIYQDAKGDTIKAFLAVYDNLERAAAAEGGEDSPHGQIVERGTHEELLAKEGVKEIEAKGKDFDPETMNAVMHIEDENFGENEVSQVFQAGFELNGKVLRHAIVQVAN